MEVLEKIDYYCGQIAEINYDNREGGRYAYVQFMVYTRELLIALDKYSHRFPNEVRTISEIHNLLNHYVPFKFEDHHRRLFDFQRKQIKEIVPILKSGLDTRNSQSVNGEPHHELGEAALVNFS